MSGDSPKNRKVVTNKDIQIIKPSRQYEDTLRIFEISFIMFSPNYMVRKLIVPIEKDRFSKFSLPEAENIT